MKGLVERLREAADGGKPLFGYQRALSPDGTWPLEKLIGKRPAMAGFPLALIFTDKIYTKKDKEPLLKIVSEIKKAYAEGVVFEFDWHTKHPEFPFSTRDPSTGKKFKSYNDDPLNSAKNIKSCLNSAEFYLQLEHLASFFLLLQEEGVEYMFRPFHEMNLVGTFWWGANAKSTKNTPEDYITLYRATIDFLRGRGCKPICVYAPNFRRGDLKEQYALLYPGDDYVDVVGLDSYNDPSICLENTRFLVEEYQEKKGKILAFTECGFKLGGYKKMSEAEKIKFAPALAEFISHFKFAYIRFWTNPPYLPAQGLEFDYFKKEFLSHAKLLGE